jgi:hypothetical protein
MNSAKVDAVHVKIAPATLVMLVGGNIRRQTKRDRRPAGSEEGRWQTHH